MTISEAHEYLDLLLDKVGSPYFEDSEKDSFITQAALQYVKDNLPSSEGGVVNLEMDQVVYSNLSSLVYQLGNASMNGSGVITQSAIQALLNTASGGTDPLMYVMAGSWTSGGITYPLKYTRHNDWYAFERNSFKRGTTTAPRYKFDSINFTFTPVLTSATIAFTVLKQPRIVSLDNDLTIDLPPHTHKAVVEIAASIASIAIRDQILQQMNNNEK
jgi:hypothetical protein